MIYGIIHLDQSGPFFIWETVPTLSCTAAENSFPIGKEAVEDEEV